MKTTIQWLEEYLDKKVLPCQEGNDYVYGMNVAHQNLIHYVIPYLLEKEKEQIIEAHFAGWSDAYDYLRDEFSEPRQAEDYYEETYNQNK